MSEKVRGPLERQMHPTLPEIESKHVERYAWAAQFMVGRRVLDAACGCGYGSWLLGRVAKSVRGIDYAEAAIAYAMAHYTAENVSFMPWNLNEQDFPFVGFEGIVSLETVEHLEVDVEETIRKYHNALPVDGVLCLSHPINEPKRSGNHFHKQFWIDDDKLKAAMTGIGFQIAESKRQPGCRQYDYHLLALRKV